VAANLAIVKDLSGFAGTDGGGASGVELGAVIARVVGFAAFADAVIAGLAADKRSGNVDGANTAKPSADMARCDGVNFVTSRTTVDAIPAESSCCATALTARFHCYKFGKDRRLLMCRLLDVGKDSIGHS
jgi:hypothetical protein